MTKQELIEALNELHDQPADEAHIEADWLLIEFINENEVADAFKEVPRWYA